MKNWKFPWNVSRNFTKLRKIFVRAGCANVLKTASCKNHTFLRVISKNIFQYLSKVSEISWNISHDISRFYFSWKIEPWLHWRHSTKNVIPAKVLLVKIQLKILSTILQETIRLLKFRVNFLVNWKQRNKTNRNIWVYSLWHFTVTISYRGVGNYSQNST